MIAKKMRIFIIFCAFFMLSVSSQAIESHIFMYSVPETELELNIQLSAGEIEQASPVHPLVATITPDGSILFNEEKYENFYYEADTNLHLRLAKEINEGDLRSIGWSIGATELEIWMDRTLRKIGLLENEIQIFKSHWLPKLYSTSNFYEIYLIDQDLVDENIQISFPGEINQIFFVFKPVAERSLMSPPVTRRVSRSSLTLVEIAGQFY